MRNHSDDNTHDAEGRSNRSSTVSSKPRHETPLSTKPSGSNRSQSDVPPRQAERQKLVTRSDMLLALMALTIAVINVFGLLDWLF